VLELVPLVQFLPLFFAGTTFYTLYTKRDNLIFNYSIILFCFICQILLFPYSGPAHFFISAAEYSVMLFIYFVLFILLINDRLTFIVNKATLFLGKISFALYLVHQFFSLKIIIPLFCDIYGWNFWVVIVFIDFPIIIGIATVFIILLNTNKFSNQIIAFTDRFTAANEAETKSVVATNNTILESVFGRFIYSAYQKIDDKNILFGFGIGAGTNVGSQLLTGKLSFIVAEGEIARVIGECGLILGLTIVLVRLNMTYKYSINSIKLFKTGDPLPVMLFSIGAIFLLQGGWAQPNALGFYVVIGSLWNASLHQNVDF
jgi:hypothetical protein